MQGDSKQQPRSVSANNFIDVATPGIDPARRSSGRWWSDYGHTMNGAPMSRMRVRLPVTPLLYASVLWRRVHRVTRALAL